MAKEEKKAKKAKKEKSEKAAAPEFKYGVSHLADKLGIEPASVRVQLRNKKVKKAGKSYGWNTRDELDEVVELLSSKSNGGKKSKKGGDDEKPAKKDKKAKKSKRNRDDD